MRIRSRALVITAALVGACAPVETPRSCTGTVCGCYEKTRMVFLGTVMDAFTAECLRGRTVVLRDMNGARVAEDVSRSYGGYRLEGEVDRSTTCGGGEPVIQPDVIAGTTTATHRYLARRTPLRAGEETVDFFRVPWDLPDAGTDFPRACVPPLPDAGTAADGG